MGEKKRFLEKHLAQIRNMKVDTHNGNSKESENGHQMNFSLGVKLPVPNLQNRLNQHVHDLFTKESLLEDGQHKSDILASSIQSMKKSVEALPPLFEKIKPEVKKEEDLLTDNKKGQANDFFENLKKKGLDLESQLNQQIQNWVNRERVIKNASEYSRWLVSHLQPLQKAVESLSVMLLFPTKKDVANVAKQVIQTEEKVDHLDDQITKLTEAIRKTMGNDTKKG